MDLQDFLNNSAFSSNNTGFDFNANKIDVSKINAQEPKKKEEFKSSQAPDLQQFLDGKVSLDPSRADSQSGGMGNKKYAVYPVPDAPPYIATIVNFPKDLTETGMKAWFEDGLQKPDAVALINIPKNMDNTNKNRAFVEFNAKENLENALKLSGSFLNENKVYVDVAPPNSYMNGGGRSGGFGNRYSAGLQFDWAKGSNTPQFEGNNQQHIRGENVAPLDWSKKGDSYQNQSSQPVIDWSQKGAGVREQRDHGVSPAALDWSQKGANARESPRQAQPIPSFDRSQMGSHLKQSSPEVSATALDWSRKGSNVKSSSSSPKVDVSSLKWEKGANLSSAPRSDSYNKKKAFSVPEKGSGLQDKASKKSSGFEALSLNDE
ncbi:hypothetical protein QEN19_000850 [Hanseniaspora menglaensis]